MVVTGAVVVTAVVAGAVLVSGSVVVGVAGNVVEEVGGVEGIVVETVVTGVLLVVTDVVGAGGTDVVGVELAAVVGVDVMIGMDVVRLTVLLGDEVSDLQAAGNTVDTMSDSRIRTTTLRRYIRMPPSKWD